MFSKTLERVEGNARLVRENVLDEVRQLKEQPGKDIEVGGAALASTLIQAGLVDEYRIYIQPIILGAGTSMFPPMSEVTRLHLVETQTFSSGVIFVRYVTG